MEAWYRVVGTSHIASQAVRNVRQAYEEFRPDAVAVELDAARLAGLLSRRRQKVSFALAREVGMRGYLFALIGGSLQRHLGGSWMSCRGVTCSPLSGSHVRTKQVLLIDRDFTSHCSCSTAPRLA